ncbi:uncharacterized protein MONBRDRAFT_24887 [Monosiga brevicollis MX1]|uniref:rRNA adenine N(6)-methyltransferase n=1 Tax=Monosiga brevicollis TaxID=81824 RepID=A9UY16_MONBE|nr:uncharacterized protein MONBRDRAFT_24887 [Monosiga brevicollis MX1]EDQ89782.1 predicted protein [Monosiga brevicollis MX1]|eukprot:XP_001745204.1 hypothetical protein [Monosiga brevicollis MX1]
MARPLPRMPGLPELLRIFNVRAKKKLSQNFILHQPCADKFVRAAGDLRDRVVVEIGGGPGSLTRAILEAARREGLAAYGPLAMTLIFQREYGERLFAPPNSLHRAKISAFVQQYCNVSPGYLLPRNVFVPEPRVDTMVVHLESKPEPPAVDPAVFEDVLRHLFTTPRRLLRNGMQPLLGVATCAEADDVMAAHLPWFDRDNCRPKSVHNDQLTDLALLVQQMRPVPPPQ